MTSPYTAPTLADGTPYPASMWQLALDEVARLSAASASGGALKARKATATPRTATAQVADPHLTLAFPANTSWDFTSLLLVTSAANAQGDFAFQFTYPALCTVDVGHIALHDSLASGSSVIAEGAGVSNSTASPTTLMAAGASTSMTSILVWGSITVGATAGSLALTWGLLSALGTTTLNIGSRITARRTA